MLIFKKVTDLQHYLNKQQAIIGFVPTMGALHNGHISLIKESKQKCSITVCSIFVNPTQFNDKKDFEKYPITIEQDILQLELADCDVLFLPTVDEIYPDGMAIKKDYELGFIETVFEGAKRPGHFNGVCMVVERLLHIVNPNMLFLGQKDYQQCIVIKKLIKLMHKTNDIKVIICATERETTGLAMSSRNERLDAISRDKAKIVYESFVALKQHITPQNSKLLIDAAKQDILNKGFTLIDYLSLANANTLEPVDVWDGKTDIAILFAGFIEGVRLIDNMILQ
jgi:pantoate--beta-alanine ligase